MGLQDFNTNREHAVGDVKSRKNLDNLSMNVEAWRSLIAQAGGVFPTSAVDDFTDEELKCIIKFYDSEIEDESFFGSETGVVKDCREDLVDILAERKDSNGSAEDAQEKSEAVEASE